MVNRKHELDFKMCFYQQEMRECMHEDNVKIAIHILILSEMYAFLFQEAERE